MRCLSCEEACPSDVFCWENDEIVTVHPGWCIRCGHCVAACPEGALEHSAIPDERFVPLPEQGAGDLEFVESIFSRRRSCRRFEEKTLSREEIEELIDKARYAPTPTNAQNVRFVVLTDKESIQRFALKTADYYLRLKKQLDNPLARGVISLAVSKNVVEAYRYHMPAIAARFERIVRGEDRLFYGAPAVIVAFASGVPHMALATCNLAAMEILIAAEVMGLGACYNGYALTALVRDRKMRESLGVSRDYHPGAVIAVGRPSGGFHRVPPRRKRRVIWIDD